MDQSLSSLIINIIVIAAVIIVTIFLYLSLHRILFRMLSRRVAKPLISALELFGAIFLVSIVLGVIGILAGYHEIFISIFTVFVIGIIIFLIGSRHAIEEYVSGLFTPGIYDLKIGDYIEIDGFRGHIVAIEPTSIIIRDPHRDLVYIPYTKLLHSSFKKFRVEEGHELIIPVIIPMKTSINLKTLRDYILRSAEELGIENVRLGIETTGESNIKIVIRGIIRDPRREEDVRYMLLDKIYSMILQQL